MGIPMPPDLDNYYVEKARENSKLFKTVNSEVDKVMEETHKSFDEIHQAAINTAENTEEMKADLRTVIRNQNDYIIILRKQNQILKNIFASNEDSVIVQKEIMKFLREQGINDEMLKDKGLDVVIQTVLLGIQMFLKSRGIDF